MINDHHRIFGTWQYCVTKIRSKLPTISLPKILLGSYFLVLKSFKPKISNISYYILKSVFSEIWSQDMSSSCVLPKTKLLISRPARSANHRPEFLAGMKQLKFMSWLGSEKKIDFRWIYRVTSVETITPTILLFLDSSWAITETLSTKNSVYLFCKELGKPLG